MDYQVQDNTIVVTKQVETVYTKDDLESRIASLLSGRELLMQQVKKIDDEIALFKEMFEQL